MNRVGRMRQMYERGWTLQQIGDEFSLSRERVRQLLVEAGVPRRPRPRLLTDAQEDLVCELYEQIKTMRTALLAEIFRVSHGKIWGVLHKRGLFDKGQRRYKPSSGVSTSVLVREYRDGAGYAEIAFRHGIGPMTVYRRIKRYAPDIMRPVGRPKGHKMPRNLALSSLHRDGVWYNSGCEKMGWRSLIGGVERVGIQPPNSPRTTSPIGEF